MQQRQSNPLNRSRTPARRDQLAPGPVAQASAGDVAALRARIDALETASLDQADAIAAQAVTLADQEARITALEAQVAALTP